jgi:hypothetical protein
MKLLIIMAAIAGMALMSFSQQSPQHGGLRKSDDAETLPGTRNETSARWAFHEAIQQPGGITFGETRIEATSGGAGYNSTISVTYDHEIEPGVVVPITVEYEPPPNMARATAMRLFRIDLQATMAEFPPYKKQA